VRRLKVIVEAYECSPLRQHAAGSAWNIVSRLSDRHDLWVVVEETQFRTEIEEWMEAHGGESKSLHFCFVPRPLSVDRCRGPFPVADVIANRVWQRRALRLAHSLHAQWAFDVAHHLRRNSFREPGLLWKLRVPFVWGPTGGPGNTTLGMSSVFSIGERIVLSTRDWLDRLQFQHDPRIRAALRAASCVLAQTSEVERYLRKHGIEAVVAHEQCTDSGECRIRVFDGKRLLQLIWIGRFISSKALPIVLYAIQRPSLAGKVRLHIAGDGPCRHRWQRLARELGLLSTCVWHGWLSADRTRALMNECDALVFSSLKEGTSATVLEAMGTGMPVVCLRRCGHGDLVTEECGIAIPSHNTATAVGGFVKAIETLIDNPELLTQLSYGAASHARACDWNSTVTRIQWAYERAAQRQQGVVVLGTSAAY
jgi:glycosyltransferase involved in cell wall biosynthesis